MIYSKHMSRLCHDSISFTKEGKAILNFVDNFATNVVFMSVENHGLEALSTSDEDLGLID